MLRVLWLLLPALAFGCATNGTIAPEHSPVPPPQQQQPEMDPVCANPPPTDPPTTAFREEAVREAVENLVRWRLGEAALREVNAASASLVASFHQGLPQPISCPGGRWTYAPPAVSAAVRKSSGWIRLHGDARQAYSPAVSAEIDRILADPAFWRESANHPPSCTDAGAQRLVARSGTRRVVRQRSCSGHGLTLRLHRLVISGG